MLNTLIQITLHGMIFITVLLLATFIVVFLKITIQRFYKKKQLRSIYKNNEAIRKGMIANKEPHKWIKIYVAGEERLVCLKSGWYPEGNTYFTHKLINSALKLAEIKKGIEMDKKELYSKYLSEYGFSTKKFLEMIKYMSVGRREIYKKYTKIVEDYENNKS